VSGFCAKREGDGSFFINTKPTKSDSVLATSAVISICLNIREEPLFIKIQKYFGSVGNVYSYDTRGVVEFKISKLESINSIIPHFKEYPLLGSEAASIIIFVFSRK
jgi:hypothetical protein